MRAFFEGIEDLFVNGLFLPLDWLRFMDSWWLANTINWLFVIIGFIATAYWLKQLKIFNDRNEERKDVTAHSYM